MGQASPNTYRFESFWNKGLPEHWELLPLGALARPFDLRSRDATEKDLLSVSQDDGVVPRSQVSDKPGRAEDLSAYKICEAGDIVLNRMSAYKGALGVAEQRGVVSPDYLVMRPTEKADARFLSHVLKTPAGVSQMIVRLRGIGSQDLGNVRTPRVNQSDLRSISIPTPPIFEQKLIVDYLDHETARLDTLIKTQENLVSALQERRQASIEQTVFRGLDESALKSPRGAEWLPDVPSHWNLLQLGFVADTLPGYAFPSESFSYRPSDVPLLRGINIKPGRIDWSDTVYWDEDSNPVSKEFALREGDLVLGLDRPFVSGGVRVATVNENDVPSLLLQRTLRLRTRPEGVQAYLRYMLMTKAFLAYLEPQFTGVSVPHMSEWQVRKFVMPFPPIEEQREIVDRLDDEVRAIERTMSKARRFIELAKERRVALITAVVTGQIDVGKQANRG